MQGVIQLATAVFGSLGSAVGAGAGAAAATGASIASTVVGGLSAINAANYQAAVAARAAKIAEMNAQRSIEAGQGRAQQYDMEALAAMSDELAAQGASGLSVASPSFVRRRTKQASLLAQDRARIIEDSQLEAKSYREQSAAYRSEAAQAKTLSLFKFLETGLSLTDTMIGGANLTSTLKQKRLDTQATVVAAGGLY